MVRLCAACAADFPRAVGKPVVARRRCRECLKWAVFGAQGTRKPAACRMHKLPLEVDVMHPRCISPNCTKLPAFGRVATRKPVFCRAHKAANHVLLSSRLCQHVEGCARVSTFAPPNASRPAFCSQHKQPGNVDVVNARCEAPGCQKQPSFAVGPSKVLRFCAQHQVSGASQQRSRLCRAPACTRQPVFGDAWPKGTDQRMSHGRPEFCKKHRRPGQLNVANRRCGGPGCAKAANFGILGEFPRFCEKHRVAGHSNLAIKLCRREGCKVRACFGPVNTTSPLFCKAHAEEGDEDVVSSRCEECRKRPSFGASPALPPVRCREHKKPGQVNVLFLRRKAKEALGELRRANETTAKENSQRSAPLGTAVEGVARVSLRVVSNNGTAVGQRGKRRVEGSLEPRARREAIKARNLDEGTLLGPREESGRQEGGYQKLDAEAGQRKAPRQDTECDRINAGLAMLKQAEEMEEKLPPGMIESMRAKAGEMMGLKV
ncbi:hypothetical protein T484DRAFT_1905896, partial [Baffinella frigidus]